MISSTYCAVSEHLYVYVLISLDGMRLVILYEPHPIFDAFQLHWQPRSKGLSLILPRPRPRGAKMRDPGNEVDFANGLDEIFRLN